MVIKTIRYEFYHSIPITLKCKNYSKLLDVNIILNMSGIKVDISYIEDNKICKNEEDLFKKEFIFLIKKKGNEIDDDFKFLKTCDVTIADSIERYYVFYKENFSLEENRQINIDKLI